MKTRGRVHIQTIPVAMPKTEQHFRIAEIEVSKIASEERLAGVFRFESSANARGPQLLLIADIHSSLYVYERLLDLLNATAEQARHLLAGVSQDPVVRFEKLIQRLNEALASFAAEEASPINWKRANLFFLELSEGHLCFTGIGRLMNAFFQQQSDDSIRAFDLLNSLDQPVDVDPKKVFASLVCGDVRRGDTLIVGTENLERMRGELQLKERLTTLPLVTAALEIQQDLERRGIPDHFLAVVISCQELLVPIVEPPVSVAIEAADQSTHSIAKLRETETTTSEQLAPALAPRLSAFRPHALKKHFGRLQEVLRERLRFLKLRPTHVSSSIDPVAWAGLRGMNAGYGTWLTKRRKTIGMAIGGGVLTLLLGGIVWNTAKQSAAEEKLWVQSFSKAADQRTRAEANLLYGNEGRAVSEVTTAELTLAQLPGNTKNRKEKLDRLRQEIAELKQRLQKFVNTEQVTELTALPQVEGEPLVAPVLTAEAAYVVDNRAGSVLKVALASRAVKTIRFPQPAEKIVAGIRGKQRLLFATAHGKLFELAESSEELTQIPWTHSHSSGTTDAVLYASKLYSLDREQSQIWRSAPAGNGFRGDVAYVKATNETLAHTISLAIDSSVYALRDNGTLLRFYAGGLEEFSLPTITPPLMGGAAIWTGLESQYLAIADPANKRIVLFDKNATLKAQIVSSKFSQPRDLDIDETHKRVLVVDGNRLLLVPLPPLDK